MTIHGSKGLEFDYVIVLDKLTRPNSDKAPLIFHYNDDLYIDKILYRTANREVFDDAYARIMEERKVSELKDRKNVLYVALTRAVEGLVVIKKPDSSIFDAIDMVPMKTGELRVQEQVAHTEEREMTAVPEISLSYYGAQENKSIDESDEEKDLDAIRFGTALHYALEMTGNFDKEGVELAMTAVRNRYGQLIGDAALEQIAQRVNRLVEEIRFKKLLEGAEIRREQGLYFNGEMKQIDLLLAYESEMLVIDYKSSQKYHLEHQKQVREYVKAVASITNKPTRGMLIYLLEDEIILENLK
jgi:exodeoxyribonuclease V beta subunit